MTEEQVLSLLQTTQQNNELLRYIAGFLLFGVVVVLLHYCYKFFKIFF